MTTLHREDGNALILVLVFIVVFGILMGSILNFSSTGINTASRIAEVRDEQHAADGAVTGAINALRTAQLGPVNGDCTNSPFVPQNATGDPKFVVTCTRRALSGIPTPPVDVPNWAILTVGTASGEGFHAVMTGNNYNLQVNGGIFSYRDMSVSGTNAKVSVVGRAIGSATVAGVCNSASVFATVPAYCGPDASTAPATNSADAAAYDYPHQAMTLPTDSTPTVAGLNVDKIPTCTSSSSVVQWYPGLYTVLPKYLAAKAVVPTTSTKCTGDVWWFSEGTYYFHFQDTDTSTNVDTAWKVVDGTTKVTVVGGTPAICTESMQDLNYSCTLDAPLWDKDSSSSLVKSLFTFKDPTLPSSADPTPIDACAEDVHGVQFMFGGKSRLEMPTSGYFFQLCSKPETSEMIDPNAYGSLQRIAIYQLRSSDTATTHPNETRTSGTTGAVAVTKTGPTRTGTLNVGAFQDIPDGSRVTGLRAKVTHSESDSALTETLDFTFPSGATATCTVDDAGNCTPDVSVLTGGEAGLNADHLPVWRDVNGTTATYTVNGGALSNSNPSGTDTVTAIDLLVDYTVPRFEASTVPSSDYFITSPNNSPTVKLLGTLFAPESKISVTLQGSGQSVFHRGVIARSIDASIISSSTQDDAPFQLPSSSAGREIVLVAHKCATGESVSACAANSSIRLRSRVRFVDVDVRNPSDPTDDRGLPGAKVQVLNWQVVRP
jgi:hypothetical protein